MAEGEMRFDDDVVIVTGAGRGLGREHARLFGARGARVMVNDVDRDVAQAVADEIRSKGGRATADSSSVASAQGAGSLVQATLDAFGTVTVLVNNAGLISYAPFDELSEDMWKRMYEVTLDGAFFMCKAVWPIMTRARCGRIVNTTSNAGFAGNPQLVHYGSAKLGVAGLTKVLAQEAGPLGLRVNAVAPMAVTRMNRDFFFAGTEPGDDWKADIRKGAAPIGPPAAISATVLWLAHRDTEVNGEIFSTSSGKVARVAFVVGEGYFKPDHTPEDLRDNMSSIRDLRRFFEPADCVDEIRLIAPLFEAGQS